MDTHVAAVLGLPPALRGISLDETLLCDDTNETFADGQIEFLQSPLALTDTHARLVCILTKAVNNNYPATGVPLTRDGFYAVRYQAILDIENELDTW